MGTELTFANNSPEQLAGIASSIPLQRLAQPDEIAKLVVFLALHNRDMNGGNQNAMP
ncbi:MAG: hypothetical protein RLZZ143_1280 [Cyanobacteriota bacterium]